MTGRLAPRKLTVNDQEIRQEMRNQAKAVLAKISKRALQALKTFSKAADGARGLVCSRDPQMDECGAIGLNSNMLGSLRKMGLVEKNSYGEWRPTPLADWVIDPN